MGLVKLVGVEKLEKMEIYKTEMLNTEGKETITQKIDDMKFEDAVMEIEAISDLERKVAREMKKVYFKKLILKQLSKGGYHDSELQNAYNLCKANHHQEDDENLVLITVNLDDKVVRRKGFKDLFFLVERVKVLKWTSGLRWVIEQRSKNPDWYGFHIHMILKTTKAKSHIIRELFAQFKDWISDPFKIDYKKIIVDNGVDNYLFGNKKDSDKQIKQIQDKLFWEHIGFVPNKEYNNLSDIELNFS